MRYVILCTLLACLPSFSYADMRCAPHAVVAERLKASYQEERRSVGVTNGQLVELYVSSSGSFTIIVTRPNGLSCLLTAGEAWQPAAPVPVMGSVS